VVVVEGLAVVVVVAYFSGQLVQQFLVSPHCPRHDLHDPDIVDDHQLHNKGSYYHNHNYR